MRLSLLLVLVLTAALPVRGQCVSGNCVDGTGRFVGPDGTSYEGGFRDGLQHGQGVLTFPDGSSYRGGWLDGKREGLGTVTLVTEGIVVVGLWRAGGREGVHTFTPTTGDTEYALFENGQLVRAITAQEAAQLAPPAQDGAGSSSFYDRISRALTNTFGSSTERPPIPATGTGCLIGDCQNFYGAFRNDDGYTYAGDFQSGQQHGHGIATWPNGDRYEGDFQFGQANGRGIHTMPDGRRYEGEIKNNLYHGQGTMTYPDGRVQRGRWVDDVFQGAK